uniref:Uncharacterized protein n=1 Tax=Arundo donax TaxID=35708 RepID=A0A0A9HLN2_ARUDO
MALFPLLDKTEYASWIRWNRCLASLAVPGHLPTGPGATSAHRNQLKEERNHQTPHRLIAHA